RNAMTDMQMDVNSTPPMLCLAAAATLIVAKHHSNIRRLLSGTEPRLQLKHKSAAAPSSVLGRGEQPSPLSQDAKDTTTFGSGPTKKKFGPQFPQPAKTRHSCRNRKFPAVLLSAETSRSS